MQRGRPGEERQGREQSSYKLGNIEDGGGPPGAERQAWKGILSEPLKGTSLADILTLNLWPPQV